MGSMNDTAIESLRKTLRRKAKAANGDMSIAATDLLALLDEIGRLGQSNDRLRRQNKRLRTKARRAGIEVEEGEEGEKGEKGDDT